MVDARRIHNVMVDFGVARGVDVMSAEVLRVCVNGVDFKRYKILGLIFWWLLYGFNPRKEQLVLQTILVALKSI